MGFGKKKLYLLEIKPVIPRRKQFWLFIGRTEAEAPILWPPAVKSQLIGKDRCWERLRAGGEAGDRGWDGWMASPIQWTWVWASSRRQWRTGKPGVVQFMGLQRVRHNLQTEQQQQHILYNYDLKNKIIKDSIKRWADIKFPNKIHSKFSLSSVNVTIFSLILFKNFLLDVTIFIIFEIYF